MLTPYTYPLYYMKQTKKPTGSLCSLKMPAAKKRKIALSSEPSTEGLSEPASTSVTADESITEKRLGYGELAEPPSVIEGNAAQNQERLERFKALQARAVSGGRYDIPLDQPLGNNEKITKFKGRKNQLSATSKTQRPNHKD